MGSLFELGTGNSRLVVNDSGQVSWLGLKPDSPFVAEAVGGLWELTIQKPSTSSVRGVRHKICPDDSTPRCETISGGYRLIYEKLSDKRREWDIGLVLDIVVIKDAFSFKVSITNREPGWLVREVRCPIIRGVKPVDSDMSVLWPRSAGERLADLERIRLARIMYPGTASMQWFALAGEKRGLYMASHDSTLQTTGLQADFDHEVKGLELSISKYPFCSAGQGWESEPAILMPYTGDWHAAARYYRSWADIWWQRPDPPDWARNSSGWQLSILKQQDGEVMWDYPAVGRLTERAQANGLDMLGLFGWATGGHDHRYPIYDPDPDMGGESALRESLKKASDAGRHPILYINGQLIDMQTDFFKSRGKDVCAMGERGEPWTEYWSKFADAPSVPMAIGCPASQDWCDCLISLAVKAYKLGAAGIIYDQLGGGGALMCFHAGHNHATPSMASGPGKAALLKRAQEYMQKLDPNFIIITEHVNDAICQNADFIHGSGSGFAPGGNNFPELIRYTFPEFIMTQRHPTPVLDRRDANFACMYGMRHEVEFRYVPDVNYILNGVVPSYKDYAEIPSKPSIDLMRRVSPSEATEYLHALIAFERQNADLLWHGKFIDDEKFVLNSPDVKAKAFVNKEKLGIVVWNPTNQEQDVQLSVPGYVLEGAADPSGPVADSKKPMPPQSVRLLRYLVD